MKILVAVVDYPDNNGKVSLMYVHTRNLFYKKNNIDVTVLNFAIKEDYYKDDIRVISLDTYEKEKAKYDLLLCHAANIRNHYRFLRKYEKEFPKIIFFYHGHEVLKASKTYSKPYEYVSSSKVKAILKDLYDDYKLYIWRHYLPKIAYKSYFIFVSNWMKEQFLKWTKVDEKILENRSSITYNSIGEFFENNTYDEKIKKEYDFATVRNNLDGSKYAIDVVNRLAMNTPDKKFVVVGKGNFFKHYKKAPNITWLDTTMNHQQIAELLNKSRFALMPTKTDAQGLMMCEMAAFGIPVITSDIPVCHEVFSDFSNAYYIDNDDEKLNLNSFDNKKSKCLKHKTYYKNKTVGNEVDIIKRIMKW